MTRLPDLLARQTATTDFGCNIVVTAGAGTGKTSLLVERVLNLIGSGTCELVRLAAITFTEKAAAELRLRIAEGLEQLRAAASKDNAPDPAQPSGRAFGWLIGTHGATHAEIAQRSLIALQQMDRARVQTIHAFCAELLRAYPIEGGVDPEFIVDTGEQTELFSREHWDRFIESELGPDGKRHELWNRVLDRFSLRELSAAARELSGWNIPDTLLARERAESGIGVLRDDARVLLECIDDLTQRATGITPMQEGWFDTVRRCLTAVAEGRADELDGLLSQHRVQKDLARDKFKPSAKLQGVTPAEFLRVTGDVRHLARMLPGLETSRLGDLVELLAPYARSFRSEFLRRGFVSFDGLLALTRDLLRDHPQARRLIKERFDTLLVDEFQDTDPLQYEIVLLLGESPELNGTDPWEVEPAAGRLFVVGDPKQSIYRFRGADYDAFRRAVARIGGEGALELTLHANFRSVAGIVNPVNTLFDARTTTCWWPDATQPQYVPIAAAREPEPEAAPAVELWTVEGDPKARIDTRRRAEGQLIANEVARLREQGVPLKRISVLFRTFASIPTYLRPLREREIPFVVDGGKDFIKRPEIKQSLAVLRTLAQPSDATALLAFLRSPAGGVADTELARWAALGLRWDWRNERAAERGAAECPRIWGCFTRLRELDRETRNLAPDAAVRAIVAGVQLFPLAAAAFEGAQRVANLHKLVAAASTLTRDGHLSLEDLVDEIEEGGLADLEADSPLSDDDTDAVRITSIHKMKGLENDWVILPDLARGRVNPGMTGVHFAVVRDEQGELWLGAHQNNDAVNGAWIRHHVARLQHEESEETRVIYVALTRARNRLLMISSPGGGGAKRWYDTLAGWDYNPQGLPGEGAVLAAGAVVHRTVAPPDSVSRNEGRAPRQELAAVATYDSAVAALRTAARAPFRAPSSVDHDAPAATSVVRATASGQGLAIGRVLHRALERWDGKDAATLSAAASRFLEEELSTAQALERAALQTETGAILDVFGVSELARRFAKIEIVARELPLLLRDAQDECWRGSIDLVYRDGETWMIADYKTDRVADDSVLTERYAGQLAIYAQAVQKALNLTETPRTELWLLRHGRRLTVLPAEKHAVESKRATPPRRSKSEQQNLF